MNKMKESKEIIALKEAKFRPYTVDTFKRYWTNEDDYIIKKARIVNATYIVVYSIWHHRLLARVFYLEEYMKYKKISRVVFEVQRQLAGMSKKISKRLYNSTWSGFKVFTGTDCRGWESGGATTRQLYRIYDNWTGKTEVGFVKYNDPFKYLKQSIHRYCAYEFIPDKDQEHNHMFEYLLKYEKHPQIEMLSKMRLSHIVDNLTGIRWSKKGIQMLGITKNELPYLQAGLDLTQYRHIREWCLKYKFTAKEAVKTYEFYELKNNSRQFKRTNLEFSSRMIRYLSKKDISLKDYEDHIKMMKELGLPNEKRYLYPENFQDIHADLSMRIKLKGSEELKKQMQERKKELSKYQINYDDYVIKALLDPKEFYTEGTKMHNCVSLYVKKVAEGECAIFSIRKVSEMQTPLATLELRDKQIIQVRADYNNVPSEEVSRIVRKWEQQFHLTGY